MKIHSNIKPIVITLIAIGFFAGLKLQFPMYKVNTSTMFNQYGKGNYVLVSKLHAIGFGDVVVIEHEGEVSITRVVGIAGDKIQCVNTELKRNGEAIHQENERFMYTIFTDSTARFKKSNNLIETYPKREYIGLLSEKEVEQLKNEPGVQQVTKNVHPTNGVSIVTKEYTRSYWSRDNFGPLKVPEGCYFLVNDNRSNSNDSREFGAVDENNIVGKVIRGL